MTVLRVLTEAGVPSRRVIPVVADVLTIGRSSESTIRLVEHTASKVHAKIVRFDGRLVLRDLQSRNGTYVNGDRVAERVLRDGDVVRVGATTFRISEAQAGRVSARTPAPTPEPTESGAAAALRRGDSASFRPPAEAGLARLRRLATVVRGVADPLELMTVLLNQAIDIFGSDRGSLVVLEEGSAVPTLRVDGDRDPEEPDAPIDITSGLLKESIGGRAVRTVEAGLGMPAAQRHMLCVPLATRSALVGAVIVDRGPGHSPFTPLDVEVAEVFSLVAGHGVADALTGAEPLAPPVPDSGPAPQALGAEGLESQLIPRGPFSSPLPGAFGQGASLDAPAGTGARGMIPTPTPRPGQAGGKAGAGAGVDKGKTPAGGTPAGFVDGDDSGARNLPRPPFA